MIKTIPLVIQPLANGWAVFPLWMAQSGTLELSRVLTFSKLAQDFRYGSDEGTVAEFFRELETNEKAFPTDWLPAGTTLPLPLDTPSGA